MVRAWASRGTSRRARRRRELVLMRASARLAAAASVEEIQSAAVDTVMAMLPATRGVRATLFRGNDQTMAFVAAAGEAGLVNLEGHRSRATTPTTCSATR